MKKNKIISDKLIKEASSLLYYAKKLSILTHINPDGDAIGSSLGLYHFLLELGFEVSFVSPNDFPLFLKWMNASSKAINYTQSKDQALKVLKESDVIFCVDFNSAERSGKIGKTLSEHKDKIVLIDHHPDPEDFTKVQISNTEVSSAAELVYYFIKEYKPDYKISKNVAECLFVGIMTDTGCFSHGNMKPTTFEALASLISKGIDKNEIYSNVYDNFSEKRMRLLGYCLYKKMEVINEYNAAFISITKDELKEFEFEIGDTEGIVNLPFSVQGIKFTALFIEKQGFVKVSLRSKGGFSVNDFSRKHYNGGGHTNAAGGETKLSLNETIKEFKNLLPQYIDSLK